MKMMDKRGNRNMKKLFCCAMSLLMLTGVLGGCSTKETKDPSTRDSKDLPVLRVAMMPFITSLPAKYIIDNKLDEKAGFKIEPTMFSTGAPMNEALAADLWDVGAMGAAAVTGVANYDMMIIGEVLESQDGLGVFTKPDSKMAKVKGFNPSYPNVYGNPETVKGSTILLPIGTAQHFTTLKWLEKIGVKAEDVNIVNMDTAQAYQALLADQCDAVALNVPTFFDAKNDKMVQVGNLADLGTKYVDMVTANRKSLKSKKDLIDKYMKLVLEACEELNKDEDMAVTLMSKFLKEAGAEASKESIRSDIQRVKFIGKDEWKDRELGAFAKELGEFYIGVGQLEPSLMEKFDTNIVDSFTKDALK